ncbi:MAG: 16S rRNA (guanine(527)-N(7))-methyltransferase RsmG [Chloroflexi bacterium]|nr:16S rRNA (guanine(527)-N(7))-methyltransferase RsmG [Chloroflexota bacterium]
MEKLESGARKIGLQLSPRQLEQFYIYYQELVDWNKRVNLTRITGCEEVQIKHFLDSLTVSLAWPPPKTGTYLHLIDVGSGAGMPGLPLKILFPDVRLVLLEATSKKAAFLRHLVDKLELANTELVIGRAEDVAHQLNYRGNFEVVLSRGVAPLATLVELTLPFCIVGGSLIAQKKGNIEPEISQASQAISLLGGKLREVKQINLEELADERQLVIIDKVSPTPELYPRRPGIPSKRPLLARPDRN